VLLDAAGEVVDGLEACVPWDDEPLAAGEMGNGRHILARGSTHLPHALPKFT
jgi:hypothetical protein